MKSGWVLATLLLACAGAGTSHAVAASARIRVQTPLTEPQAQKQLDAVLDAAGQNDIRPLMEISDNPSYAIASISGDTPRIVLSRQYLSKLSKAALTFALAHEVAHLRLKHHAHIKSLRNRNEQSLAAAPESVEAPQAAPLNLKTAFHAIEFSADELAMKWCESLGCGINDAAQALSQAYGWRTSETESHPALQSRLNRLQGNAPSFLSWE